jgi:hypothetical protein
MRIHRAQRVPRRAGRGGNTEKDYLFFLLSILCDSAVKTGAYSYLNARSGFTRVARSAGM